MKKDEAKPPYAPAGSKICITAKGKDFEAEVDPNFSQAKYFLLLDPMAMTMEIIENPHQHTLREADIQSAQFLSNLGVGVLITGEVGPKTEEVLKSAGIQFVTGTSGKIKDVIQSLAKGVK